MSCAIYRVNSTGERLFYPYPADLRNTRDNKFVNEVKLCAHFMEEEEDFLLIRNETGANEGWIYSKHIAKNPKDAHLWKYVSG